MLPKSRIDRVTGLTNSSMSSIRPTNNAMIPAPIPCGTRRPGRTCQVSADAEALEALVLEEDERDEGQPDRDVDVARSGRAALDAPTGGIEPAPVAEQDEDEERRRTAGCTAGPARRRADAEILERLVGELERVLEGPAGASRIRRVSHEGEDDEDGHDDPLVTIVEVMLGWNVTTGRAVGIGLPGSRSYHDVWRRELERAVDVADRVVARVAGRPPVGNGGRTG